MNTITECELDFDLSIVDMEMETKVLANNIKLMDPCLCVQIDSDQTFQPFQPFQTFHQEHYTNCVRKIFPITKRSLIPQIFDRQFQCANCECVDAFIVKSTCCQTTLCLPCYTNDDSIFFNLRVCFACLSGLVSWISTTQRSNDMQFLQMQCHFNGCEKVCSVALMIYHMNICEHRLVYCHYCYEQFPFNQIDLHTSKCPNLPNLTNLPELLNLPNMLDKLPLIECFQVPE